MKLEIGQEVIVKHPTHNRGVSKFQLAKVTAIRKKYFDLNNREYPYRHPFKIDSMVEKAEYMPCVVYLSQQEIDDEEELKTLESKLKKVFQSYGELDYSISQLREVCKILNV